MGAAAALIRYLGLMSEQSNFWSIRLVPTRSGTVHENWMLSALKALNLMPGPRDGAKTMSFVWTS